MTPAGRAAFTLYGLVLLVTVHQGAGVSPVAAVCLVGMYREASRAALDEPGRDRTGPGTWRRWRADRQARALLRAEECTCDAAWWPSPTRPHAPYCRCARKRSNPS